MNQDELLIRPAREADADAISQCVSAAYHNYIERIGKPPRPMLEDYREVIRRCGVFVLTESRRIIAVLVLIIQPKALLLDNVAVAPAYQGRGFGRKLMAFAEEEARRLGLAAIILYTNVQMTENMALYKKLGYIETERKTEQGYQRVYMRKILLVESV